MVASRKWVGAEHINFAATTQSLPVVTRQGLLFGWSFEESTGGAVAQLELIDGSSDNGNRIVPITLLANQSTRDIWGYPGIWCDSGVFCSVLAGSVSGTIFYKPLTPDEIVALVDQGITL